MSCFVLFLGKARMPLSRLPHKLATHDGIDGNDDDEDVDDDVDGNQKFATNNLNQLNLN